MRRWSTLTLSAALLLASCSRLGLGIPECEPVATTASSAMILTLQAVPTAAYAPCVNSLQLGWESVEFEVESGRASFSITRSIDPFFTATLTQKCDTSDAEPVPHPILQKYEDVQSVESDIKVAIVPSAERPLIHARIIADDLTGVRVGGRQLVFTVDSDVTFSVRSRVNGALMSHQFVWIISELDVNENTLEMRRTPEGEGTRGISVNEAVRLIEETAPEPRYVGNWFFVFDGGCITYEFDAHGTVAETVAEDVNTSLGFYPLEELRELGRRQGFEIGDPADG